nr:RNA-dependent RNA polymerase [Passion fruit yellow mosaic virus]UTS84208.1 RNA-dependent RNA polymerase [Passion fruit yellow mosaic virus]
MAFQLALDALNSTSHRDSSLHPVLESVHDSLKHSLTTFPWSVSPDQLPFLLKAGVPVSGLSTLPHPHPVHKTLETNLLFNHWSFLANEKSSVIFMKPSKFAKLQRKNPNFQELCNYRVTPTDSVRYPSTTPTLPSHPTVFMHDALMYMNPEQILHLFLQAPALTRFFCSLVVPPESHFTNLSLHPSLYQYQLVKDTLHYTPERHHAGSYNQPIAALNWLKISSIQHPKLQLSVTILESWGPLHSILIQRGLPLPPPTNFSLLPLPHRDPHLPATVDQVSFQIPDCLELPEATFLHQPLRDRLVPTTVYNALFTYTRAVRTLRTSDPAGFVRSHSNKPEHSWVTPSAWDNLQTFALLNCPIRPNVCYLFFQNPLEKIKLYFQQHWRRIGALAAPSLFFLTLLPRFLQLSLPLPKVKCISAFRKHHNLPPHPLHQLLSLLPKTWQRSLSAFPFIHPFLPKPAPYLPRFQLSSTSIPISPSPTLALFAFLVPELAFLVSHITGTVSLQAQHDTYHHHLHPPQFHLTWARQAYMTTSTTTFLPFHPLRSLPQDPSSPPLPPFPSTPRPPLTPEDPMPLPPSPALHVDQPISAPPAEPYAAEASERKQTPLSPTSSASTPSLPAPPPSKSLPQDVNESVSLDVVNQLFPSSATPDSNNLPPPPLMSDATATGPVLPFSSLHPRNYHTLTASFPTRLRVSPPSNLPLPSKKCLLTALSEVSHIPETRLWLALQELLPESLLQNSEVSTYGLSTDLLAPIGHYFNLQFTVISDSKTLQFGVSDSPTTLVLHHTSGPPAHYSSPPKLLGSSPPIKFRKPSTFAEVCLSFTFNGNYLPISSTHFFSASQAYAKNLSSNMKNGFDGILSSIDVSTKHAPGSSPREKIIALDHLIDVQKKKTVELIHIAGFAGCGKTRPLQSLLSLPEFKHFRVSCPTTELRNEWKSDMRLPASESFRFNTWESSLLKHSQILVIDEIYKMPRGYLDLSIFADPSLRFVIILGDPLQGEYHSSSPHSSNHTLPPESRRLLPFIDHYCFWTYRVPRPLAELFDVSSFNSLDVPFSAVVSVSSSYSPGTHNLVNSIATANAVNQLGFPATTISSSQGSTYNNYVTILLDKHSRLLSPSHALVALTRSLWGVKFLGDLQSLSGTNNSNDMFSRALNKQRINLFTSFPEIFHLLPLLRSPIKSRGPRLLGSHSSLTYKSRVSLPPHVPVTYDADVIHTSTHMLGDALDARPETLHLPPTRLVLHSDLSNCSISNPNPSDDLFDPRTPHTPVYPGETFENLAAFFLPAHDPDLKEILFQDLKSNQFPWLHQPFHLSCQPSSLIAARHSPAKDPTLLPASISKRLRFRPSKSPHVFSSNDVILGHLLYQSWCDLYSRHPHHSVDFNAELFADCIAINDFAQLSNKTRSAIVANQSRSDPDWRHSAVRIFAKSQHKVNDGSIFGSWKACQTLALMHDFVILSLGPVKKYQRFFDTRERPSHIYTHCGKTPSDLSKWCSAHLSSKVKLANDYTAFDQSQHGESVIFESLKMKRLSIPSSLIQLHIHLKTNVSTQFGPLTCMRLTGEPGTYDDNTDYNLAVLNAQYDLRFTPVLASGDDSLLDSIPPERPSWPTFRKLLHLKFKREVSPHALFCGYYVGPKGAIRNPLALFAKLMIAIDDQTVPDKMLSYISEFSIGHLLGDDLWSLLPDHLHPFQSACFDFFCRNAKPFEKALLSSSEIPSQHLAKLTQSSKWLSQTAVSSLPLRLLKQLLPKLQNSDFHFDPKVSLLESELLHSFQ